MNLIQGNSIEYFKDKTDLNISLVITSPSYFIDNPKRTSLENEIGVGESKDDYINLLMEVFTGIYNNLTDDGVIVVILGRYNDKPIHSLLFALEESMLDIGLKLSRFKTFNTNNHESIVVFQKRKTNFDIPDFKTLQTYEKVGFFGEINKEVIDWAINSFTIENDFIVDPFAGTGGTLKRAELLKRESLGIELNPKFI